MRTETTGCGELRVMVHPSASPIALLNADPTLQRPVLQPQQGVYEIRHDANTVNVSRPRYALSSNINKVLLFSARHASCLVWRATAGHSTTEKSPREKLPAHACIPRRGSYACFVPLCAIVVSPLSMAIFHGTAKPDAICD